MRNKPLVLIDYHSRYPVVTSMKTVNSVNIKSLENHFHSLAIHQKAYLSTHNIEHHMVTPFGPSPMVK